MFAKNNNDFFKKHGLDHIIHSLLNVVKHLRTAGGSITKCQLFYVGDDRKCTLSTNQRHEISVPCLSRDLGSSFSLFVLSPRW